MKKAAKSKVKFKGSADLVDVVQTTKTFSPDGQAGTFLFRNLEVATDERPVNTRAVTLSVPLKGNDKSNVSVKQDIRGFVQADRGTRASLVVQAGGKTRVIDLKKTDDGDFTRTITSRLGRGDDLLVTFFLLAERLDAGNDVGALLQIDSLDVSISKAKAKGKK